MSDMNIEEISKILGSGGNIGGLVGGAIGLAGPLMGLIGEATGMTQDSMKQFGVDFEPEQRYALEQQKSALNAIKSNDMALKDTLNSQRMDMQAGKAGAISQAANVGAGMASNAGLGGDISSALIGALQGSAPIMAQSAQYDTAMAGLQSEYQQGLARNNQMKQQGARQIADIGNMTTYMQQDPYDTPFMRSVGMVNSLPNQVLKGAVSGNLLGSGIERSRTTKVTPTATEKKGY
jgi:precorrin-6B methylase 2